MLKLYVICQGSLFEFIPNSTEILQINIKDSVGLKVHKIENFFASDFGICDISLLVMSKYKDFTKKIFDWAIIGGGTIFPRSPRTTRNGKNF